MRAGAEGEGEVTPIEEGGAVVPIRTPTIIIIHKIKVKIHRQMPDQSLIRKAPNIKTYQPVQAGPVPSTGKKAGEHPTALIPWSVSGSPSWPPEHEPLANSASRIVLKI